MRNSTKNRACPNSECGQYGEKGAGNIIRHGFAKKKRGRTRRFRCTACRTTASGLKGTPYYRLQHSRNKFDQVAAMSVEGVSKSAISRIMEISWNTVARWIEKAAVAARAFNQRMTKGYDLTELQLDEIRTFSGSKIKPTWVFVSMAVWSRLWAATVIGRRSYKNTRLLLRNTLKAGTFTTPPFITTDGFLYYSSVIRQQLSGMCVHGQVIKEWRKNRVGRITRSLVTGTKRELEHALLRSEDSDTINTSFIERLNLTIRRGSSYLQRRTPCHVRRTEHLASQLELLRCHYNFIRPHRSLKFGDVTRTPAMQAGITSRQWTFRTIFLAACRLLVPSFFFVARDHRNDRDLQLCLAA